MLAGNRLRALPASLAACQRLELLRIAANELTVLPEWLLDMPRLAWLAFAGNPFCAELEEQALAQGSAALPGIDWSALQLHELLGEGASGVIHRATHLADGAAHETAVKLFKGAMTSDGLPRSEMAACIAAGTHDHLVGVEGRIAGHPQGAQGLVLRLIPADHRNLAGPPSLATCTRDVYADGLRLNTAQALRIARGMASALAHLHWQGIAHGDLYAHNIVINDDGDSLLGDFGAASFMPPDDAPRTAALQRIDRRALAHLIDELAQRCDEPGALAELRAGC